MTTEASREQTDMALELAELCERLTRQVPQAGDDFLAGEFGVEKWTPDFFAIVFAVVNRTQQLERLLESEGISEAVLKEARSHLGAIRSAFDRESMRRPWKDHGMTLVSPNHSSPVRLLSGMISRNHSFDRLTPEDIDEIRAMVAELVGWLKEHQIGDRDFIRECLIEGLEQFDFRIARLSWFGWAYSVQSLKDILMAYFALERGINPADNPDASAVLQKVGAVLKKLYGMTHAAKDTAETADWALSFARAAMKIGSTGSTFIAGYLTGS